MRKAREPMHLGDLGDLALAIIPTYNERENLASLLSRLHAATPAVHVLIVDDGSPDGTGTIAEQLAGDDARVHVLHRASKVGLGAAYVAGFRWGLERGYSALVEMDADGSHAPEELPRLLAKLDEREIVLGSRYVQGGRVVHWARRRELLSKAGNMYSRFVLGIAANDLTGGFRAYPSKVLESLSLRDVAAQGYCFQIDLVRRAVDAGFSVTEVPITFTEREVGESKMSGAIVREAVIRVGIWGMRRRWNQLRALLRSWSRGHESP